MNNSTKKKYWKNSEDFISGTVTRSTNEFQPGDEYAPSFENGVSRRTFMALVSASMAVGAVACRRPDHKLVPTVQAVEYLTPGIPLHYTTVYQSKNAAYGLLVRSSEGKPTKIDGNDKHPISRGRSTAEMQAELLSLYDPDRIRRASVNNGDSSTANALLSIGQSIAAEISAGKQVRFLIDEHASATFNALIAEIESKMSGVKFITVPSYINDGAAIANNAGIGINGELVPDLSKAQTIISIDADFLGIDKNVLYHTSNFSANRKPTHDNPTMSQLISVESMLSLTGAAADKRFMASPSEYEAILAGVYSKISNQLPEISATLAQLNPANTETVQYIVNALQKSGDKAVVLTGAHLSPAAHALTLAINSALGNIGLGKILYQGHVLPNSGEKKSAINTLVADINAGNVGAIVFCDINPEYNGNPTLKSAIVKVKKRFFLGVNHNETADICSVSVPTAHFLESWGDAIAFDGTHAIQQPMIAPLNDGSMSLQDSIIQIVNYGQSGTIAEADYYSFLRRSLTEFIPSTSVWETSLREGVIPKVAPLVVADIVLNASALATVIGSGSFKLSGANCYIVPSNTLGDGRLANNGWLVELPDPITKVTWDNVICITETKAKELDVQQGDFVRVSRKGVGSVTLPAYIQPGLKEGVSAISLGWGRTSGGKVLVGNGDNASRLLAAEESYGYIPVTIEKATGSKKLAMTQTHHTIDDDREIINEVTLIELAKNHKPEHSGSHSVSLPLSIVSDVKYKGHRWGMTIDLSACTGCNACTIACQAENNIPVIGREQVANGRIMTWIRLDRYYSKPHQDKDDVEVNYMPMLCQHCENAPCENVCPVAATTHSPEGLNEMTYNRCVGTKYCANNCPYKVRRFNWLNYHKNERQPLDLVYNPDVTIRGRGVIEKCSFCVQRINHAKYHAKDQGHSRVKDGDMITACQQACPAGAIYFGDMNDSGSNVMKARSTRENYKVLEEINVRPSIAYMYKVRNREVIASAKDDHGHHG